jgi:hypothetical protein
MSNYYSLIFVSPDEAGELHSLDMSGEYETETPEEAARKASEVILWQCEDISDINDAARIEHLDDDGEFVEEWNALELLEEWNTVTTAIPTVEIEIDEPDCPSECGGMCFAEYTISLTIGTDCEVDLSGFLTCGWLQPGADADLDGSGLSCWGDAQHGGWRCVSGDGVNPRRPLVDTDEPDEPDEPISIQDGAGNTVEIVPAHVPAWRDAVATGDDRAIEIRASLVEALADALSDYDIPGVEEPTSEQVYEDLPETDWPGIRIGDWQGAGLAIAWETSDGYEHRYWPADDDVADAADSLARHARRALRKEIERLEGRDW